ncbi:hypothetical protein [Nostoc sp. 106C]|uniref:hypothetical protein n=1 Tax=Nostoc sp. 106C TaxID=1932667 RepID=UPI0014129445|nr:hypothetical protein [Nostoc sp. 106C]
MGGFPDLSEVAFERSETQLDQGLRMLGFVPQPNLRLNLSKSSIIRVVDFYLTRVIKER